MATTLISVSSPGRAEISFKPLNLGRIREHKGLSLQQIAEKTKISMRFLIAIENEEFSKLPGGIFDTSYLRQYASAIGFEESKLLAQYRQKSGCNEDEPAPPRRSLGHWLRWLTTSW